MHALSLEPEINFQMKFCVVWITLPDIWFTCRLGLGLISQIGFKSFGVQVFRTVVFSQGITYLPHIQISRGHTGVIFFKLCNCFFMGWLLGVGQPCLRQDYSKLEWPVSQEVQYETGGNASDGEKQQGGEEQGDAQGGLHHPLARAGHRHPGQGYGVRHLWVNIEKKLGGLMKPTMKKIVSAFWMTLAVLWFRLGHTDTVEKEPRTNFGVKWVLIKDVLRRGYAQITWKWLCYICAILHLFLSFFASFVCVSFSNNAPP